PKQRPAFQTKLEQAADLLRWLVRWLTWLGKPLWLAGDGTEARRAIPSLSVTRPRPQQELFRRGGDPDSSQRVPWATRFLSLHRLHLDVAQVARLPVRTLRFSRFLPLIST